MAIDPNKITLKDIIEPAFGRPEDIAAFAREAARGRVPLSAQERKTGANPDIATDAQTNGKEQAASQPYGAQADAGVLERESAPENTASAVPATDLSGENPVKGFSNDRFEQTQSPLQQPTGAGLHAAASLPLAVAQVALNPELAKALEIDRDRLEDETDSVLSHDVHAFAALARGAGAAGRVHRDQDDKDNSATLAGKDDEDEDGPDGRKARAMRRMAMDMMINDIVNQVLQIDRQLAGLYQQRDQLETDIGKLREELNRLDEQEAQVDAKIERLENNLGEQTAERQAAETAAATAEAEAAKAASVSRDALDEAHDAWDEYQELSDQFYQDNGVGYRDKEGNYFAQNSEGQYVQITDPDRIAELNKDWKERGVDVARAKFDAQVTELEKALANEQDAKRAAQLKKRAVEEAREEETETKKELDAAYAEKERIAQERTKVSTELAKKEQELNELNPKIAELESERAALIDQIPPAERAAFEAEYDERKADLLAAMTPAEREAYEQAQRERDALEQEADSLDTQARLNNDEIFRLEQTQLAIQQKIAELEQQKDQLEQDKQQEAENNEDLKAREQDVQSAEVAAARKVEATGQEAEKAAAEHEQALEESLKTKDGHAYAKTEDGKYVYVDGPNKGEEVAKDQRAVWWKELSHFGRTAEEIRRIEAHKERAAVRHENAERERDAIKEQRDDLRQAIRESDAKLEKYDEDIKSIDKQIEDLRKDAEALRNYDGKLNPEQQAILDKWENLNSEKQNLTTQRDEEIDALAGYKQEYRDALTPGAVHDYYAYNIEKTSQAWERFNEMSHKNSGYSDEEIEAQVAKLNELRTEREQLEKVMEDIKAGKDVDVTQLPQTLQTAMANQQFVDEIILGGEIDFDKIPADKMDLAAETILQGNDKDQHLPSMELNLEKFSPDIQKQIIAASIKQDMDLNRAIDVEKRFPPEMQDYARHVIEQNQAATSENNTERTGVSAVAKDGQGVEGPNNLGTAFCCAVTPQQPTPETGPAPVPETQTPDYRSDDNYTIRV